MDVPVEEYKPMYGPKSADVVVVPPPGVTIVMASPPQENVVGFAPPIPVPMSYCQYQLRLVFGRGTPEAAAAAQSAAVELIAVRTSPADGVPVTVIPPTDVAALVPVLAVVNEAPAPIIIAAAVLVPLVMPLNACVGAVAAS